MIVLEGTDGSGKQTQTKLLSEYLEKKGNKVKIIDFPNYKSNDLLMLKNMLAGDYGNKISDINVYVTTSLYALDRWNTLALDKELSSYDYIIFDRYVESMMIYAANRYDDFNEKIKIVEYIYDLEYNKFKLPMPDKIIFLNRDRHFSKESLKKRDVTSKTGSDKVDIIESDTKFLNSINSNYDVLKHIHNDKVTKIDYSISETEEKDIDTIHKEIVSVIGI